MAASAVVEEEEQVAGDGEAPEAPKRRSKKLLLLIAAPLLLLPAAGGGLYFMGFIGGGAAQQSETKVAKAEPAFFDVPEMLVNINSGNKRTGFLKIAISLELPDAKEIPKIQVLMPRILDNFQTYLRELRVEDLKGSAGLYRLREELLMRVNAAIAPAKVNEILFKEMLVQ
ncbi:MAG TPA: flagellar basal body-associated FliL family protein [Stellaceae bacterium]|nr:flagellar basal body-associated FliL family protein [Stellaceae bacterium]